MCCNGESLVGLVGYLISPLITGAGNRATIMRNISRIIIVSGPCSNSRVKIAKLYITLPAPSSLPLLILDHWCVWGVFCFARPTPRWINHSDGANANLL